MVINVRSGVPQGLVLVEVISSVVLKLANDTKVGRMVESGQLQSTINRLVQLSEEW